MGQIVSARGDCVGVVRLLAWGFTMAEGGEKKRDYELLEMAIDEAYQSVKQGHGYPFGAIISRDGKIIVKTHNKVHKHTDPTAHAEVTAIREASQVLGTYDLSDCEMFASCEPCPMCFGAIQVSKLKKPSVSIFCAAGAQGQRAKEVFLNTAKNIKFETFLTKANGTNGTNGDSMKCPAVP